MIRFGFRFVCLVLVCFLSACASNHDVTPAPPVEYHEIKVMTFNILFSTSNKETEDVLRATAADIIGLQEVSTARLVELAQQLKYHSYHLSKTSGNLSDQDAGILSRFPITAFYNNGVIVKVNPNLEVAIFTVHLSPYPYQPYDFRDGFITTPQQAVSAAAGLRLPEINPVLDEMVKVKNKDIPVFLTGDFNEPPTLTGPTQQRKVNYTSDKSLNGL